MATFDTTKNANNGGNNPDGTGVNGSTAFTMTEGTNTITATGEGNGGNGGNGAAGADGGASGGAGKSGGQGGDGAQVIVASNIDNDGVLTGGVGGSGGAGGDGTTTAGAGGNGNFGGDGIFMFFGTSLDNSGSIIAGDGGQGGDGGQLNGTGDSVGKGGRGGQGGSAVNVSGPGTVNNSGTITGGNGGSAGDSINGHGGNGNGGLGIYFIDTVGTVNNSGTITGGDAGGPATGGMGVGAQGFGGWGIQFSEGGTLTNSGTISGGLDGNGDRWTAVQFIGGNAQVIIENGAAFIGDVVAEASYNNTILFAAGATPGVFDGSTTDFIGWDSMEIQTGATWTFDGGTTFDMTLTNNGTINQEGADALTFDGGLMGSGFVILDSTPITVNSWVTGQTFVFNSVGDALNLGPGASFGGILSGFNNDDFLNISGLEIVNSEVFFDGEYTYLFFNDGNYSLMFEGEYTADDFYFIDDGKGGITIAGEAPCFCPGTLIETSRGPLAVETLAIGDLVHTHNGALTPVRWIGRRRCPELVLTGRNKVQALATLTHQLPVRIRAGALGDGLPRRDLYISPDHAMLVQGCLVQAQALVNGRTIEQMRSWAGEVQYFHIETEAHEIILAEGAPCETFVDNVSREKFDNHAEFAALYPDAAPMAELDLPRINFARQLPRAIARRLEAVADELLGARVIAA